MADLFVSQLTDPFRIVLLIGLLLTMARTSAVSGIVVPLLAGIVFVAVLIPLTLRPATGDVMIPIVVGVLANAVILAVLLGLYRAYLRFRG